MTPNQYLWAQARDRLVAAVTGIGFSAELAELMAKQLDSSRAAPLCGSATSPRESSGFQRGAAGACPLGSSAGA